MEETGAEASTWYRTKWALIGASIVVVLVVLAGSVALGMDRNGDRTESSAATPNGQETQETQAAIADWWANAHTPVTELRESITDARRSANRLDPAGLEDACQKMHDLAAVDVHTYLPAPVPELNSELAAAAEDAHAAAHMCLSVVAGSKNAYTGEFMASVEQAERRLIRAQEIVNKALLVPRHGL
ncbi:hypothetical protein A5765_01550 [Mycolicibacterium celeriflavum]|nr:hypothetical protein A5765_01550 [Mycolicibacterium celeriflavum]